jgi:protoheme IX farnesyltransferase
MTPDLDLLRKSRKKLFDDLMELTKFKLSLLNSFGAYTMFFFHAPLAGVGLLSSLSFVFAT